MSRDLHTFRVPLLDCIFLFHPPEVLTTLTFGLLTSLFLFMLLSPVYVPANNRLILKSSSCVRKVQFLFLGGSQEKIEQNCVASPLLEVHESLLQGMCCFRCRSQTRHLVGCDQGSKWLCIFYF